MEVSADQLQRAVEGQHGGKAVLFYVVHVHERFDGQTVWDGYVHVFDLEGTLGPRGPMRGRHRSRAAITAAFMQCCTWAAYDRH